MTDHYQMSGRLHVTSVSTPTLLSPSGSISIASHLIPSTDNTYNLGEVSTPLEWGTIYVDGVGYIDTVDIGTLSGNLTLNADINYVTNSKYPKLQETATSTEAGIKYLLMKDASGNVRRVPSYNDA